MTYRNDLAAAHARIASLEGENQELKRREQLAIEPVASPKSSKGAVIRNQRTVVRADEQEAFIKLFESEFRDSSVAMKGDALTVNALVGLTKVEATLESDSQGTIALQSEAGLREANAKTRLGAVLASPIATFVACGSIETAGDIANALIRHLGAGWASLALFGSGIVGSLLVARFLNKRRERRVNAKLSKLHYRWLKGQTEQAHVQQLTSPAQYQLTA